MTTRRVDVAHRLIGAYAREGTDDESMAAASGDAEAARALFDALHPRDPKTGRFIRRDAAARRRDGLGDGQDDGLGDGQDDGQGDGLSGIRRHETEAAIDEDDAPAPTRPTDPTDPSEELLAEVLADVLNLERVSVTSDFFDDLGADSMVMALFCARLRKRDDLPSLSIKQVYQHPTIESLARAVSDNGSGLGESSPEARQPSQPKRESRPGQPERESAPEAEPRAGARSTDATTPVGAGQLVLCGGLQLLTLFGFAYLFIFTVARGYEWIAGASGFTNSYQRLVLVAGAVFLGGSILPIVAKWVLIGRWQAEQFRVWSLQYFRFWFVKFLLGTSPMTVFVGTPVHVLYLRALGARIGRGVVMLSGGVVCTDLLTVGDNTIIRKDSAFPCYRAHAGFIQTGPVSVGRDAFVGESTVLDIDTSLGDGAQLGHSSSLHAGQSVPDGEHRIGSPADQGTEMDYLTIAPADHGAVRRVSYSVVQLLVLFAVSLPALFAIPILVTVPLSSAALEASGPLPFSAGTFYGEALIVSSVLFFGVAIIGLVFVWTVPRLLSRAVEPGEVYPLYGVRYWVHRAVGRITNVPFFTNLFGDTSYILHYLYLLGYNVSFQEQTGANFGLNVKHDNPFHVTVGPGTMAADGLSIINADYSTSSFRVAPVEIGAHSFFGNSIAYPSQGKTGENCLHATKVMVPVEGEVRENTGFLGSPSFEIPRLVLRDRKFDDIKEGDEFGRRLAAKNRHNLMTMGLFLLTRWFPVFATVLLVWSGVVFDQRIGPWATVLPVIVAPMLGFAYFAAVERASIGFQDLRPLYCSMYDVESWRVERYWKLSWQPTLLDGTPFKSLAWRFLGVRIGRRVFDDGCLMIDKTLITVGDHCVLNAGSVIQPHSQEDGTFKSDRITIGDGCTLGVGSLVHYGVTMGDGATLAADAFLMKGADVPPHTRWGDNPARELEGDHVTDTGPTSPALLRGEDDDIAAIREGRTLERATAV